MIPQLPSSCSGHKEYGTSEHIHHHERHRGWKLNSREASFSLQGLKSTSRVLHHFRSTVPKDYHILSHSSPLHSPSGVLPCLGALPVTLLSTILTVSH